MNNSQKSHRVWRIFSILLFIWILVVSLKEVSAAPKKSASSSKKSSSSSSSSSSSKQPKEPKAPPQQPKEPVTFKEKPIEKDPKKAAIEQEKKFNYLTEKLSKYSSTNGGVIPLTDDTFTRYVIDRPREYHAILMFTATNPMYKCNVCNRAKSNYEDVARAYHQQYNFSNPNTPIENRIVFFSLEVDDARSIFGALGLESVPRFYALPPTTRDTPKMKIETLELEARPLLEGLGPSLELISEKTNVKILLLHDPVIFVLGSGFVALLVALFVTFAQRDFMSAILFYQNRYLWNVISLIAFGVGVSGSIFCIIRSPPLLGYGSRGDVVIFAPQGRDQYSLEGVVVALWTIGCGLSYFLMYYSTKIRFPIIRHLMVILSFTIFIVLLLQIFNGYTHKTMWYSLKETFPQDVWQYLTSSVKKQSGVFKRLLRVSEIWLQQPSLESFLKEPSVFYKKVDQLVVDYVKRTLFPSSANA